MVDSESFTYFQGLSQRNDKTEKDLLKNAKMIEGNLTDIINYLEQPHHSNQSKMLEIELLTKILKSQKLNLQLLSVNLEILEQAEITDISDFVKLFKLIESSVNSYKDFIKNLKNKLGDY